MVQVSGQLASCGYPVPTRLDPSDLVSAARIRPTSWPPYDVLQAAVGSHFTGKQQGM